MAVTSSTTGVKNLNTFLKATAKAEKESRNLVRSQYRKVGDIVKVDAAGRFRSIDAGSAAGFRTVVRQRGVSVEQSKRRTTGKRPDYGALQMRLALMPGLEAKEEEVVAAFDQATDVICQHFDGR
jgi:hypothetical protein